MINITILTLHTISFTFCIISHFYIKGTYNIFELKTNHEDILEQKRIQNAE
jgi:hypothetical protein